MKEVFIETSKKRLWGVRCPQCGMNADGATGLADEPGPPDPEPGDYSVCLYCGGLNRYGRAMVLEKVDRTERRRVTRKNEVLKRLLETAAEFVAQRKRERQ